MDAAIVIRPSGEHEFILPKNGTHFVFEGELYDYIETDTIQAVSLTADIYMLCDEHAKVRGELKPVNHRASRLLHKAGGMLDDEVLGTVVIVPKADLR